MIRKFPMDQFGAAVKLAEKGLVVLEGDNELFVLRPASIGGTVFRGWEEQVTGSHDTILKTNAPRASVKKIKKGWEIDISIPAAPGPEGIIWHREKLQTLESTVEAIIECYFGDRVNFNTEMLDDYCERSGL